MRTALCFLAVPVLVMGLCRARAEADDDVVNTPVILSALKGSWVLPPEAPGAFQQELRLDGSRCGDWHRGKGTLPVSITFYVEGHELLIQHYHEPKGAFNYRLKQLRYSYTLDGDTLTLTRDKRTETWKRVPTPK